MFSDFRTNLSRKITPFRRPEILYSDKLEISLQAPALNQVKVDAFDSPITTDNYCFISPKINRVDYAFGSEKNFDVKKTRLFFLKLSLNQFLNP